MNTKKLKETLEALREEGNLTGFDLRRACREANEEEKIILTALIKERRRELLRQFVETRSTSVYKKAALLTKYMFLLTGNNIYNQDHDLYIVDGHVLSYRQKFR